MDQKVCKCGCGEFPGHKFEYKRGHKPAPPRKTKTAKPARSAEPVVEVSTDDEIELTVNRAWLDQVFALFPAHAKAAGISAALSAMEPEAL